MPKPIVTITGVSEFIGSRICLDFLNHGGFRVRGIVRNKSNAKKVDSLREAFGDELFGRLELVDVDLLREESVARACEGSTYIVHAASPTNDARQGRRGCRSRGKAVTPASNCTLCVMKAARRHAVKKVVLTSSVATIVGRHEQLEFTEDDWRDLDESERGNGPTRGQYCRSLTSAERIAWDFVNTLPEQEKFALVTINPSIVMGPPCIVPGGQSESLDLGAAIVTSRIALYPRTSISVVDVRDVSRAHLEAVIRDEADGRRFVLAAESPFFVELATCLLDEYGEDYDMRPREMGWLLCATGALFDGGMKHHLNTWNKRIEYDGSEATELLGIKYIKHDRMMLDMTSALIKTGLIEDLRSTKVRLA